MATQRRARRKRVRLPPPSDAELAQWGIYRDAYGRRVYRPRGFGFDGWDVAVAVLLVVAALAVGVVLALAWSLLAALLPLAILMAVGGALGGRRR